MSYYSRRHYAAVSPKSDTARDIANRHKQNAAFDAAKADVAARFPEGINASNAYAVLDYQEKRQAVRLHEAFPTIYPKPQESR